MVIITRCVWLALILTAALCVSCVSPQNRLAAADRAWLASALKRVDAWSTDQAWRVSQQTQLTHGDPSGQPAPRPWFSPNLVILGDGEPVVCDSRCNTHPPQAHHPDMWIGRASDGKWYGSSEHFCRDMLVLSHSGQPDSLHDLTRKYRLHEFSGRLEDAIPLFWPTE
jgi:hypothetical protein